MNMSTDRHRLRLKELKIKGLDRSKGWILELVAGRVQQILLLLPMLLPADQFKAAKQELERALRKAEAEERRVIKEAEEAREPNL